MEMDKHKKEHKAFEINKTVLFDLNNLSYRAEGNNTIVVSNNRLGLIIRIRKTNGLFKINHSKGLTRLTELFGNYHLRDYFGSHFTRNIRLVKTTPTFLVNLEKKIEPIRPSCRKSKSIDHSESYVFVTSDATRIPNDLASYAFGPTLCVELKPKFGAIPLWPATGLINLVKNKATPFCLRQLHKSKLSRWNHPSAYCPCDLFSGDEDRMVRGLSALLATPQNNIRIYLDSHLIFSSETDELDNNLNQFFNWNHEPFKSNSFTNGYNHIDTFAQFITNNTDNTSVSDDINKISTDNNNNNNNNNNIKKCHVQNNNDDKTTYSYCEKCFFSNDRDRLIRGLLTKALLYKFKSSTESSMDSMLTEFSNEQPFSMNCALHPYNKVDSYSDQTQFPNNQSTINDVAVSSKSLHNLPTNSILYHILRAQLISSSDISFIIPHYERVCDHLLSRQWTWETWLKLASENDPVLLLENPEVLESFNIVEKYLISLVARDCSIMVTMQRVNLNCPPSLPVLKSQCPCIQPMLLSCAVIDLDPKPLDGLRSRPSVETSVATEALNRQPSLLMPKVLS